MLRLSQIAMTVGWVMAIIYATIPAFWLLIHPFAGYWRSRRRNVYPLLVAIWVAISFVAGFVTAPYRYVRLWPEWSWLGWAMFLLLGISVYHRVGRGFGRENIIGQSELRPEQYTQRLVKTGIHGRIRHPIYLAHWLMLTAWTVGAGTGAAVGLWAFAALAGLVMIHFEDRELEQRFGDEYREYKKKVPPLIPRF
jgi:protein-S-isoprenylcysteine O-methyltransferase Ste14